MMRLTLVLAALLLAAAGPPVAAQGENPYAESWYRADFWSGEYPSGFTVLKDTTLKLRPELSPTAEATIDCPLPAKATYHPWNVERSQADGLSFVSFTERQEYETTAPYEAEVYGELDEAETALSLPAGARWSYLAYYVEGTYLMEYEGVRYTSNQGLMEVSKQVNVAEGYDEWMRINCPNNRWGWLHMKDLPVDEATFSGPNIVEYGRATDLE